MINNFQFKQGILLVCLIGIVGSAASLVNSIFPNNSGAMLAAAVGSAMFVLFIALTAELTIINLSRAILDQKQKDNDELISVVIAKAVYRAISEEKEKKI